MSISNTIIICLRSLLDFGKKKKKIVERFRHEMGC